MKLSARQGFRRNVTSKPENSCSTSDIPLLLPLEYWTKFSEPRTKTDPLPPALVHRNHLTPAGMEARRSGASSAKLGRATESLAEHAFAHTLLDCMIVDEEHVRHDTILPLRAHDRRAHAVRPMFVSLTPTAGAGCGSAHELRARPVTSVHFPGRIPVRAAPRVRKRGDGFRLPG